MGLYHLNQFKDIITNESVGIQRDEGLAVVHKYSGHQMDRLRKNIINFFKKHGPQITIEINLEITDFLDIYRDLEDDKMKKSSTHT